MTVFWINIGFFSLDADDEKSNGEEHEGESKLNGEHGEEEKKLSPEAQQELIDSLQSKLDDSQTQIDTYQGECIWSAINMIRICKTQFFCEEKTMSIKKSYSWCLMGGSPWWAVVPDGR